MEEDTAAFPDLSGFEFVVALHQNSWDKLRLPDKLAELLDGREPREVKPREAGGGCRLRDVEVVFDGDGHMHLGRGWDQFAREHDVHQGHFLVFAYNGDDALTVKVFDGTMCRRHYHCQHEHDDVVGATPVARSSQPVKIKEEEFSVSPGSGSSEHSVNSGGENSVDSGSNSGSLALTEMQIDDAPTSQFTVMLRQCHLGVRQMQYLNVPVDFQVAHEYRKSDANPGEDHQLKVEVRKRDGTFAH